MHDKKFLSHVLATSSFLRSAYFPNWRHFNGKVMHFSRKKIVARQIATVNSSCDSKFTFHLLEGDRETFLLSLNPADTFPVGGKTCNSRMRRCDKYYRREKIVFFWIVRDLNVDFAAFSFEKGSNRFNLKKINEISVFFVMKHSIYLI